jgi:hypothetical protein
VPNEFYLAGGKARALVELQIDFDLDDWSVEASESERAIEREVDDEISAAIDEAWWVDAFKGTGVTRIAVTGINVSVTPQIREVIK